jgi:hypothetical protein
MNTKSNVLLEVIDVAKEFDVSIALLNDKIGKF